jgi:hypothetical protein
MATNGDFLTATDSAPGCPFERAPGVRIFDLIRRRRAHARARTRAISVPTRGRTGTGTHEACSSGSR